MLFISSFKQQNARSGAFFQFCKKKKNIDLFSVLSFSIFQKILSLAKNPVSIEETKMSVYESELELIMTREIPT